MSMNLRAIQWPLKKLLAFYCQCNVKYRILEGNEGLSVVPLTFAGFSLSFDFGASVTRSYLGACRLIGAEL